MERFVGVEGVEGVLGPEEGKLEKLTPETVEASELDEVNFAEVFSMLFSPANVDGMAPIPPVRSLFIAAGCVSPRVVEERWGVGVEWSGVEIVVLTPR